MLQLQLVVGIPRSNIMYLNRSISMCIFTDDCYSGKTYMCETHYSWSTKCRWSTLPSFSTQLVHYLMLSRIMSCTLSDLPILLASTVSLNLLQFVNHGRQRDKTMSIVNTISWDQGRQLRFFIQGGSSSISSRNICFTIPIGLWMTEPEGF